MELTLSVNPVFFTKAPLHYRQNHRILLQRFRHHQFRRSHLTCRFSLPSNPSPRSTLAEELQSETLKILEWNRVCNQLSAFTSTSMGLSEAQSGSIPMGQSLEESQTLLAQTTAALSLPRPLDLSGIVDVSGIVESSRSGQLLTIGELCSVTRTLRSARRLMEQLEEFCSNDGDFSQR